MTARRSIVGLTVLCALCLCAFSAASASAAGTTAFTCSEAAPTKSFSDADCTSTTGTLKFGHIEVAPGTTTELKAEGGAQTLKGTIAGIKVKLTGTAVELKPSTAHTIVNTAGTPMSVTGTGTFTYTGVKVVEPAGQGCVASDEAGGVGPEMVSTEPLTFKSIIGTTATTTGIEFAPVTSGGPFAIIHISGCSTTALNGNFKVTGAAVGTPTGAKLKFTEASTAGLLLAGQKATLEGEATVSGKAAKDGSYTALSLTTTAS
jgi:hypothetical protein